MAWLGKDKDGNEVVIGYDENSQDKTCHTIILPPGTIEKLTGKSKITELIELK